MIIGRCDYVAPDLAPYDKWPAGSISAGTTEGNDAGARPTLSSPQCSAHDRFMFVLRRLHVSVLNSSVYVISIVSRVHVPLSTIHFCSADGFLYFVADGFMFFMFPHHVTASCFFHDGFMVRRCRGFP